MILKSENKNFINIKDLFQLKMWIFIKFVSNKVSFSKKGFKYFIGYKDRFIDVYVYFSQKLVYIFLLKDVELLKK